jgi:hypothetical protein
MRVLPAVIVREIGTVSVPKLLTITPRVATGIGCRVIVREIGTVSVPISLTITPRGRVRGAGKGGG